MYKQKSYLFPNPPFCFFRRTRLFCRLNVPRMFFLGQYKKIKCLLCTRQFEEKKLLVKYYITDHKINITNWFFKALFKEKKETFLTESAIGVKLF